MNSIRSDEERKSGVAGNGHGFRALDAPSTSAPRDPPASPPSAPAPPPDPFNIADLRLDVSFVESAGVRRLITSVPVGKPNRQDFFRTHASPDYRQIVAIIELKDERETYLLSPQVAQELPGEFQSVELWTCINPKSVS
jgi:hypothetical protein